MFLFLLSALASPLILEPVTAPLRVEPTNPSFNRVSYIGDINDDGIDDLSLGERIWFGQPGLSGILTTPDITMGSQALNAPVSGDFNGDGLADLAVANTWIGVVYVFHGPFSAGTLDVADADAAYQAPAYTSEFGKLLRRLPDQDGDGDDELVVFSPSSGAHRAPNGFLTATLWLIPGEPSPVASRVVGAGDGILSELIYGPAQLLVLDDVHGDGQTDLLLRVGASVYLIPEPWNQVGAPPAYVAPQAARLDLASAYYLADLTAADMDADGAPDLLLSWRARPLPRDQDDLIGILPSTALASATVGSSIDIEGDLWTLQQTGPETLGDAIGAVPDRDGDGRPELMATSGRDLQVMLSSRLPMNQPPGLVPWRPAVIFPTAGARRWTGPNTSPGDINADGQDEVGVSVTWEGVAFF